VTVRLAPHITVSARVAPRRNGTNSGVSAYPPCELEGLIANHRPQWRTGRYTGRRLWRVADRIDRWIADGTDVYGYFNNDYGGDAVVDALWLREHLDVGRQEPVA
jgi:uncharacterized protein YecE (DUF72 family)